MKKIMSNYLNIHMQQQTAECLDLLKMVLQSDLSGVYLYGSSIIGGLQKYSDLDLLVVTERATTDGEKKQLIDHLLQISGIYMKSSKLPIEMTLVVQSEVNPWHYPPHFDFQYGDWLREPFENGQIEPWPTNEMPDLAILITQVLLASQTLFGSEPHQLLSKVPYKDFMAAQIQSVNDLMINLDSDTRNVLLTSARIWSTVETDSIHSKPAAADWVMNHLPEVYQPVMKRAKAICMGKEKECWDDINGLIKPCAEFMVNQINQRIAQLNDFGLQNNRSIKLA